MQQLYTSWTAAVVGGEGGHTEIAEAEEHDATHGQEHSKHEEAAVVPLADTAGNPRAVMVHASDTAVAHAAVLRSQRANNLPSEFNR